MTSKESIYTNKKQVSCKGKEVPYDHPNVYLGIGDDNKIICPYCSKIFVYNADVELK